MQFRNANAKIDIYNMVNIMKNKTKYLSIATLTLTAASVISLPAMAYTTGSTPASVTVPTGCTFSSSANWDSDLVVSGGNTANTESEGYQKNIVVNCNSSNGFAIQAIGIAPDSTSPSEMVEGNTSLYNSVADASIPTGTSGDSYWSFKAIIAGSGTSASITPGYASYASVPDSVTTIASFANTTSGATWGAIRTDYQVHASAALPSGTYTGAVKYTILPNA